MNIEFQTSSKICFYMRKIFSTIISLEVESLNIEKVLQKSLSIKCHGNLGAGQSDYSNSYVI